MCLFFIIVRLKSFRFRATLKPKEPAAPWLRCRFSALLCTGAATWQRCVIKKLTTSVFHYESPSFPGSAQKISSGQAHWDRAQVKDLRIHEKKREVQYFKMRKWGQRRRRLLVTQAVDGALRWMQNISKKKWQKKLTKRKLIHENQIPALYQLLHQCCMISWI